MDIIEKATELATGAHKGQVRKTDGTPYIEHPIAVGQILKEAGFDEITVASAIVHDVLEDTDVTEEKLRDELGDQVANVVTAVSEDKELPWEERKEKYAHDVAKSDERVKAVSIADKIHNLKSLIDGYEKQGSAIWSHFNRGKEKKMWFEHLVLDEVKKTWEHPLLDEYEALIKVADGFDA